MKIVTYKTAYRNDQNSYLYILKVLLFVCIVLQLDTSCANLHLSKTKS